MAGKISELLVSNHVLTFQDADAFEVSQDDGLVGYTSGAYTWADLVNNVPTFFKQNGTLANDRTVNMDNFSVLFTNGPAFGFGLATIADISAHAHFTGDGSKSMFGVGNFEGNEPLIHSIFAIDPTGGYMAIVPSGSDISDASTYRYLLGLSNDGIEMSLYHDIDQKVGISSVPTSERIKLWDDSGNDFSSFFANGDINLGSNLIIIETSDSKIGFFNTAPVVQQTGGAATAGGSYTATEQGMIQRMYDGLRNLGLLD